ncbi:MAG TPA: type II toxin-antitoxin system VapC family toxin, partial [Candidatus Sulfotelmatobacter sp.]|nr:type II toxin-antitoxin system VapC family toxin [Candidatus Sulfotelmatobacter sp.]
ATRYLLDTNTVSYVLKGNFPSVRERLQEVPISAVSISVITEAELLFGLAKLPHARKLAILVEEFLRRIEILPWDSSAARHYARLRAGLEESGQTMGNLDLMIAAQGVALEATVVTNDRIFRRVKDLRLEDWTKP